MQQSRHEGTRDIAISAFLNKGNFTALLNVAYIATYWFRKQLSAHFWWFHNAYVANNIGKLQQASPFIKSEILQHKYLKQILIGKVATWSKMYVSLEIKSLNG